MRHMNDVAKVRFLGFIFDKIKGDKICARFLKGSILLAEDEGEMYYVFEPTDTISGKAERFQFEHDDFKEAA